MRLWPTEDLLAGSCGIRVAAPRLKHGKVAGRNPPTDAREARFTWVDGAPFIVLSDAAGVLSVLDRNGRPFRFSDARLVAAAARLQPESRVAAGTRLTSEDSYWYAHHGERPLPVLRVRFADEARTWYHIHPQTGQILGRVDAEGRMYRWLFNGLHSLDFGPLIRNRPVWDVVVWSLSAIGLMVSITGVVIAWRRLAHKFRRRPVQTRRIQNEGTELQTKFP